MKFVKFPLLEAHKPLPTVYFGKDGKEAINFKHETFIDGGSGEVRNSLTFETNDKEKIKLIEDMEKELSKKLTIVKRSRMRRRMKKFEGKDTPTDITEEQIGRINIKCAYGRGGGEPGQQQRQLEKPQNIVS